MDTREYLTDTIKLGIVDQHLVPIIAIFEIRSIPSRPTRSVLGRGLADIFKAPGGMKYMATYTTHFRLRSMLAKIIFWRSGRKDLIRVFGDKTIEITAAQYYDLEINYNIQVRRS